MTKPTLLLPLLFLAAAGALGGCGLAGPEGLRDRALDLADCAPASVAWGRGIAVGGRLTPFLGLGAGWAEGVRAGMDRERYGPLWWEKSRGFPFWFWYRVQDPDGRELTIPGGDPYFRSLRHRIVANSFVVVPGVRRGGFLFWPRIPPYARETPWEWTHWAHEGASILSPTYLLDVLDAEVEVFAGVVGLRVGFAPLHILDFGAGLFGFDPESDDPKRGPVAWPDPGAEPSFPEEAEASAP